MTPTPKRIHAEQQKLETMGADVEKLKEMTMTSLQPTVLDHFPIFMEDDYPLTRDQLYGKLTGFGIDGRRCCYPLIT